MKRAILLMLMLSIVFSFVGCGSNNKTAVVLSEWNRIDQYFVADDADSIRLIMKNAEANTDLSNWNKLRIINECTSALVDLRLSGQD